MLDLISLFNSIQNETYCVIKLNDKIPQYSPGEDIDIFCYNPDSLARKILEWGNAFVTENKEIRVESNPSCHHIYIDFVQEEKIHFRFDLHGALPRYKHLQIKSALFESILENSSKVERCLKKECCVIKVPSDIDDLILRYIEFIEWYNVRPDKIKHLDYILAKIDSNKKEQLLDKLHYYTKLPEHVDKEQTANYASFITKICTKLIDLLSNKAP